jgi:hypothetical protein
MEMTASKFVPFARARVAAACDNMHRSKQKKHIKKLNFMKIVEQHYLCIKQYGGLVGH